MTYIDPFTMEHVTEESEEGKTGWDVHAGTGLQYCINPNLEINLGFNYAYQPIVDWQADMGGFAVTAGIQYHFFKQEAGQVLLFNWQCDKDPNHF